MHTSHSAGPVVIALDTSNEVVALGLGRLDIDHKQIHPILTREVAAHRASNTTLLPTLDEMFREAGLSRGDVACVVCGRGPGSFTGVRIAMAHAKGLAQGLGVALIGVSTLDAIAYRAYAAGVRGSLLVLADAMRKEVYPAPFTLDETGVTRLNTDTVIKATACMETYRVYSPDYICGDALVKYSELFQDCGEPLDESLWHVSGEGLLRVAEHLWQTGEINPFDAVAHNPAFALPVYTRLSDAEEHEREKLKSGTSRNLVSGVQASDTAGSLMYRPLDKDHAADVAALESEIMGSDAWRTSMVEDEIGRTDRSWWMVLDEAHEGRLVGYAGALIIEEDMQILKVGVHPDYRRQHIAQTLLAYVASDARDLGAKQASLEVRVSNNIAQQTYHALGFHDEGVRPHYYSDKEDALIMSGPLPTDARDVAGMDIKQNQTTGHYGDKTAGDAGIAGGVSTPVAARASASTNVDASASASAGEPIVASAPVAATNSSSTLEQILLQPPREEDYQKLPLILAIESSCDETACAIITEDGKLVSDALASQIDFHARFGGVVPEIASRKHIEAICGVVDVCLENAALTVGHAVSPLNISAVAVTYAPGLVGALVVGVAYAKAFAWACDIPLIKVNHLEGHIFANLFETPDLTPPAVVSLVSGGHTMLVHVKDWGDYEILGQTLDDAVGEAFDKVAKAMELGYPGGPIISRLAKEGNPHAVEFPRALLHSGDFRFSLSGLKTAVISHIHAIQQRGEELPKEDIAASFQAAVIEVQVAKAMRALKETGARELCVGGGVAANPELRRAYKEACEKAGVRLTVPPLSACTDNAAMIALVAQKRFAEGKFESWDLDACAHASLDEPY